MAGTASDEDRWEPFETDLRMVNGADHARRKAAVLPDVDDTEQVAWAFRPDPAWTWFGFVNYAEVTAWRNAGFDDPNEAANWDDAEVLPTDVPAWQAVGCGAVEAGNGQTAGVAPSDLPAFAAVAERVGIPARELVCLGSAAEAERWAALYQELFGGAGPDGLDRERTFLAIAHLKQRRRSEEDIVMLLRADAQNVGGAAGVGTRLTLAARDSKGRGSPP